MAKLNYDSLTNNMHINHGVDYIKMALLYIENEHGSHFKKETMKIILERIGITKDNLLEFALEEHPKLTTVSPDVLANNIVDNITMYDAEDLLHEPTFELQCNEIILSTVDWRENKLKDIIKDSIVAYLES